MKVEVKIPKGWRRVRVGERLKLGDLLPINEEWKETHCPDTKLRNVDGPYIRNVKRK